MHYRIGSLSLHIRNPPDGRARCAGGSSPRRLSALDLRRGARSSTMTFQMHAGRTRKIGLAAAVAVMMTLPQIAEAQETVLKGMISGRSGDTLMVRQGDGSTINVKV